MPNRKISRRKSRRPRKSKKRSRRYGMTVVAADAGSDLVNWEHPFFDRLGWAGLRIIPDHLNNPIVTFKIPTNLINNPHRTGERIFEGRGPGFSMPTHVLPPPLRESRMGYYWTDCCNQTLYTLGILKTPRDQEIASTIGDFISRAPEAGGWTDGKLIKVIEHRVWEYSDKTINLNLNFRDPFPIPSAFDAVETYYIDIFINYIINFFDNCTGTICISKCLTSHGHCFIIGKLSDGSPIIIDYQQSQDLPASILSRFLQNEARQIAGHDQFMLAIPCDIKINLQMEQLYYIGKKDVTNYLTTLLKMNCKLHIPYGSVLDQPRLPAFVLDDRSSRESAYYIKPIITDNEKEKFRKFLTAEQCWVDEIGPKFYTHYSVDCNYDSCYFGLYNGYRALYDSDDIERLRHEEINGCYLLTKDRFINGQFSNIPSLNIADPTNRDGYYISHVCVGARSRKKGLCQTLLIPSIVFYSEQINEYRKGKGEPLVSYLVLLVLANNIPAQRCYTNTRFNFIQDVTGNNIEINMGNKYYAMIRHI